MTVLVILAALCLLSLGTAAFSLACALRARRRADFCFCRLSGLSARVGALNRRLDGGKKEPEGRTGEPERREERQTERWIQGLTDILAYSGAARKKEEAAE